MNENILKSVEKIHEIFKSKKLTLAVAESCTGGLISHYITSLPGASVFFMAGVISYASYIKEELLGVAPEIIDKHGIISDETARAMAEKIRVISHTSYSVSSTGNLGPDVLEDKERGLVYVAASKEGMTISKRIRLRYDRERNKEEATLAALNLLLELVESDAGV